MLRSEDNRITKVGLLARSPEGTAAKGMQIKDSDLWIEIQAHTFRNWVNEHLRPLGLGIQDWSTDFCDGTALVALIEALQKRTLKKIHKPNNQHQMFENVSRALDAIAEDGVKLVNIGSEDIVNGNVKLILGLIWSLIVHYQIGQSKLFPPKKLMLAWLRSVLPGCQINNFTSDWNSGKNLSALINYCRPDLCQNWRKLSSLDGEENCKGAMELARKELGVPVVLEPEYLASPHLDELSGMTYISYFMKENGPGYKATMNWIRNQLPEHQISNFTKDWNDGKLLSELVRSYGGPITQELSSDPEQYESNLTEGIKGGEKLGIKPVLRAKDMADPNVDHLGTMAYVSSFQWLPKRSPPGQRVSVSWESKKFRRGLPITLIIECQEGDLDSREITIEVNGPSGKIDARLSQQSNTLKGIFSSTEIGIHEVIVKYQGEPVQGSPLKCRILPPQSRQIKMPENYSGLEPCAVGSVVEVLVNPQDANSPSGPQKEFMEVLSISPSGNYKPCIINKVPGGSYAATFQPDEVGEWKVSVKYKGKDIQGSPFPCYSFNPNGIKLDSLEGAVPGLPFSFTCDSRGTGQTEADVIDIDVTHEKRSIPHRTEYISDGLKRIVLPVLNGGKHRVHVYFNGTEIRGSPFPLRVGYRSRRRQDKVQDDQIIQQFVKPQGLDKQEDEDETSNSRFSNFKTNKSLFISNNNSSSSDSIPKLRSYSPFDSTSQEFNDQNVTTTLDQLRQRNTNDNNKNLTVYNHNLNNSNANSTENIFTSSTSSTTNNNFGSTTYNARTTKHLVTDSSSSFGNNNINSIARKSAIFQQQQYVVQLN